MKKRHTVKFSSTVKAKVYTYEVVISRSLLESEDLMEAIFAGLIVLFVIFLVALFLLNRYISRNTLEIVLPKPGYPSALQP